MDNRPVYINTQTHTHIYIYIYMKHTNIYMYMCVCFGTSFVEKLTFFFINYCLPLVCTFHFEVKPVLHK